MKKNPAIPKQLQNPDFRFVLLDKWNVWKNSKTKEVIFVEPKDYQKYKGNKDWKALGKIPFENEWEKKDYKFDNERLTKHINQGFNFGVISGYGKLRILDIDKKELAEQFEKKLNTYTIKTGSGGRHFYFISDYETNHVLVNEQGELRANNYQVVSAPCRHPSGNYYEIINNIPITEISSDDLSNLIKPYLREEQTSSTKENKGKDTSRSGLEYRKILALLRQGKSREEIYKEMTAYSKWASAPEQYRTLTFEKAENFVLAEQENNTPDELNQADKKGFPKGIAGVDFSFNEFFNITYKKNGDEIKKANIDKVVEYLMELFSFKTIFGDKSEEIYVYRNGIYLKKGRAIIQTKTEEILKEYATIHNIREVQEKIKRLTEIDREQFDFIPEELVCLRNGILNLKTKELEPHNPKYYFKRIIPIEYNPKAKCPKILKFLKELLYPEYVPVIQEWFGFNLYRKYFIKKAIILFGEQDTGKTQILNLLIRFIGEKNKTGISLQSIARGNRFELSFLKDKYANIRDDLSSDDFVSAGEFKAATGGSYITAEYKFGDTFEFQTFAKHIFATNKIPRMKDNDKVFYSRCMPIPFDNPIPKAKQKPNILQEITTKEEMSGLLNLALKGLSRLFKNNKFSYNKSDEEIKRLMERDSEPLACFVQDCLIKNDGNKVSKQKMFELYSKYCEIKELPRLSIEQLGRRLPFYAPFVIAKGGKERCWDNVDIRKLNIDTFDTLLKNLRDRRIISYS